MNTTVYLACFLVLAYNVDLSVGSSCNEIKKSDLQAHTTNPDLNNLHCEQVQQAYYCVKEVSAVGDFCVVEEFGDKIAGAHVHCPSHATKLSLNSCGSPSNDFGMFSIDEGNKAGGDWSFGGFDFSKKKK
uniref:Adhesive protein 5 n=1 Tax=Minona ileanae TaxID=60013 RepID=A0A5J6BTM4_9PLAT|nr:adhesive protein 5 [Minona ileanae]